MRICVLGSGGREHALADKIKQSPQVETVLMVGITGANQGSSVAIDLSDFKAIETFLTQQQIDLTIVGPEQPLCEGIVDYLTAKGHRVFGPGQKAAQLEGSKIFAKHFMNKYDIPTAAFAEFYNYEQALDYSRNFGYPQVIKANGLCAGKGVYICQHEQEACQALNELFLDKIFAESGNKVVIEKYLSGFEASLCCFVAYDKIIPMQTAMDYKKIYEADRGPNTGGVGCVSPNPYWTKQHDAQSDEILRKIEKGLKAEQLQFYGILFIGYLVENDQVYVLEFNTRFGDPETEVLLPRLNNDLLDVINQCLNQKPIHLSFSDDVTLAIILVSKGYPKKFKKYYPIQCPISLDDDCFIYHNGTKRVNGQLISYGGRVLSVVAKAKNYQVCRDKVFSVIAKIHFENMAYRKDIGIFKG